MKKRILSFLLMLVIGFTIHAQDYKTGLGFRFGGPSGFNLKYNKDAVTGYDFTLGFWDWQMGGGFSLTGLYEIHKSLNPKNLRLYYGGGVHLGSSGSWSNKHQIFIGGPYAGIDGVVGLEYTVREIPLALSLDFLPRLTFGNAYFGPEFYMGFTIRYVMNKSAF